MTAPLALLEDVTRSFPGSPPLHALRGVSLSIDRGDYLAVIGPSGSGKSTLLNILGLLQRPTSGRYLLDGRDVAAIGDRARTALRGSMIGFVFQDFHLLRTRTAAENVMVGLLYGRSRRRDRRPSAVEALDMVGLADRRDDTPDKLSGGERQRVAIARAVVGRPALLLADEPTGNLDTGTTESIVAVLDGLNRAGLTVVVVTHDPQVSAHAARRVDLVDGRLTERQRVDIPQEVS